MHHCRDFESYLTCCVERIGPNGGALILPGLQKRGVVSAILYCPHFRRDEYLTYMYVRMAHMKSRPSPLLHGMSLTT